MSAVLSTHEWMAPVSITHSPIATKKRTGKPSRNPHGRPKGVPNSINGDVRAMILEALNRVGGARYLARRAEDTPASFMALLGKILPANMVGGDGGALSMHLLAAQLVSQQLLEERARQPEPVQDRHLTIDHSALPTE